MERTADRAGLATERVTPRALRHPFATHYIKNGGDPFSLQRILGHSDIKTTMIYVNLAGVGLREAHAKTGPADRVLSGQMTDSFLNRWPLLPPGIRAGDGAVSRSFENRVLR
jgi:hypothetical protein